MKWQQFRQELAHYQMSQNEFSRLTGLDRHRITYWKSSVRGVPEWVKSWFQLFARLPEKERVGYRELRGQP